MALRAIRRVTEGGAYSNLAVAGELDRASLSPRDRHLVTELVYGTLRELIPLDHAIAQAAGRPLHDIDPQTLATLRLGAYQILHTRIPPHAAVSETVDLASGRSRGFVNAVLRRLASAPPPPPAGHTDQDIALRSGLAPWAVGELRRLLPEQEVEPAATAFGAPAGLSLRVNPCRTTPEALRRALEQSGHEVRPGRHSNLVLTLASAAPAALPGFREGWFAVQDEASVLVAEALQAHPGERILDACAAPGGKASHLACAVQPGGRLIATDVHPRRAALVVSAARRLHVSVHTLVHDAGHPALREGFDAVLVDAPCSGLGAARRRPELLWRPQPTDLARLARLQVAILAGVGPLVRPGGRLVYSVCTFPRAETDAAVRAFLAKRPDFEPADVSGPDGPAPTHRLWPHRDGTDGMFLAGFRRTQGTADLRPTWSV